jgi:hypothetical protein
MEAMRARMAAEGGSRNMAREIYTRMYADSGDPHVKEMARRRLLQLESLEQRDAIANVLSSFRHQTGRCASTWREVASLLRAVGLIIDGSGAPLDPAGTPYLLQTDTCSAALDPKSEVPSK